MVVAADMSVRLVSGGDVRVLAILCFWREGRREGVGSNWIWVVLDECMWGGAGWHHFEGFRVAY